MEFGWRGDEPATVWVVTDDVGRAEVLARTALMDALDRLGEHVDSVRKEYDVKARLVAAHIYSEPVVVDAMAVAATWPT